MQRWKVLIEYDGRSFAGWQRQADGILSVQQVVEEAITKFSGEVARTIVAGRTDAGVHARGQVAHFDLARPVDAPEIMGALNFHLKPHPVAILAVEPVADTFSARFDAFYRTYEYRICCRRAPLALDKGRIWQIPTTLDVAAMQAGAQHLLGQHDFSSFRATACQAKSPIRTLDSFVITAQDNELICRVGAPSFLHHQVRNMVGTLVEVGKGKWTPDDVATALAARDRRAGGPTAPPDGLYFMRVDYP